MAKNSPQRLFYGYFLVLFAFLLMMIMWGTFYSFGIFLEPVLIEFDWTRAATSGAFSLCLVVTGFFAIFAGKLNDRYGPRIVMTGCSLFLGAGYFLMSQISVLWQLYLFYGVIVGIGSSGSFVPLASTVSRWFVKRRGLMTGIIAAGISFGTMIMPPIASWLISSNGWRISYMIIAIVDLVLVLSISQFLRRDPGQMGLSPYGGTRVTESSAAMGGFSFVEALRTGQFWLFCAILFCSWFGIGVSLTHVVIHATGIGISTTSAANTLAIIGLGSFFSRITMGGIADKIGNKSAIIIGFMLMLIAFMILLKAQEVSIFYFYAFIFGFAYGNVSTLESLMVADLFGLSSHGIIFGAVFFSDSIGGAVGAVLGGRIFDITNSYKLAFIACAGLSIIAIILSLLLRPIAARRNSKFKLLS